MLEFRDKVRVVVSVFVESGLIAIDCSNLKKRQNLLIGLSVTIARGMTGQPLPMGSKHDNTKLSGMRINRSKTSDVIENEEMDRAKKTLSRAERSLTQSFSNRAAFSAICRWSGQDGN